MSRSKDILFYSDECDFCKELLMVLVRKNLRSMFMIINVNNHKFQLPSFVDRVPLVYTMNDQVYYGDALDEYISSLSSKSEEILPFALSGGAPGGEYSDAFSYLEDMNDPRHKSYTMVGMEQKIMSFDMSDDSKSSETNKIKFDSSSYDKYIQERDNDIASLKKQMNTQDFKR
jgi:hypothetical protein